MDNDLQELRERISLLDDAALLRIIEEEADSYRPEALAVAREEARRRGIEATKHHVREQPARVAADVDTGEAGEVQEELEQEQGEDRRPVRGFLCPSCGTGLRRALLLGETQVIAVLEPNNEQRFVYAMVCQRCGTADLFVDFETEVEE